MQILCTVDIRTRELYLEDVTIAAFDHLVDDVLFVIEPIDGFQLETSTIKIAAVGPLGEPHDYEIDHSTVTVDEETGNINFVWSIPVGVTAMPLTAFKISDTKNITFAVCAEIVSGDNLVKAWHSDDGTIKVKAHLEPESGGGEDPSEEATNAQKIGQLQTAIAILQREISGIASGTPPTADSTSEMDHDVSTVYINTTDGKWYYWNGTSWVVGGTYGGAVTSTTFTKQGVPADDFATGQALAGKADADDVDALDDRVTALESGSSGGLTADIKSALLACFANVAWINEDGQDFYDALDAALNPPAELVSISAVYTQSGDVYDNQTLDSLRGNLVVTARYDNGTSTPVTAYTLSGALATGTSTITVAYGGKTATFTVVVTHATTQYSITNNLTNCVNSNTATVANENTSYSGTLSASSGYVLGTVTVVMGGTDITSTAYDSTTGGISIASVTGNVVITAEAVEDVGWVSGVPYTLENWTDGYNINNSTGEPAEASGYSVTDFLPCSGVDCFINANLYQNYRMYFYDAEKNFLGLSYTSSVRSTSEVTPKFRAAYVRSYASTNKKASVTVTPYDYPALSESTVLVTGQRYAPNYIQYKFINVDTGVIGDSTDAASYATEDYGLILGATKGYFSDKESKYWVHFYDAGKNHISTVRGGNNVTSFDIPEGAYYARFVSQANKGFYWFE